MGMIGTALLSAAELSTLIDTKFKVFKVKIDGTDVTSDITSEVLNISVTDSAGDADDKLSISLHDVNKKWIDSWYPETGTKIELTLFDWQSFSSYNLGVFKINSLNYDGNPRKLSITGTKFAVSYQLRSSVSRSFTGKTLKEIVTEIATESKLTDKTITITDTEPLREEQKDETNMQFLTRLAGKYNYFFKAT